MGLLPIILLSLALAVDVFGISFAYGLIIKKARFKTMMKLALVCGLFQATMPIIGFVATSLVSDIVATFDYLLVFVVFTLLGLNVIREALSGNDNVVRDKVLTWKTLLLIGLATSIDALVAGTMLYLTNTPLVMAVLTIGLGSLFLAVIGFNFNYFFKKVPEKYLQIVAGLVLVGLGIKTLVLHFVE